eukprot:gene5210-5583_t
MFHKSAQTQFTGKRPPVAGHYLNKHTKEQLKKRKLQEKICLRDANTLTYNLLDDTTFILEAPTRHIPVKAISVGRESCGKVWFDRMNDAPDLCFKLLSSQIRVRSDGTCTCYSTFQYRGTAIVFVDPNKVRTILAFCKENNSGVLTLPDPFDVPAQQFLNCHPSFNYDMLNPLTTSGIQRLQDEENRWQEIHIPSDQEQFQRSMHKLFLGHLAQMYSIPPEENDYLYKVLDMALYLGRKSRDSVVPSETETLRLGCPFQYVGEFSFQLDEESRIVASEMLAYLGAKEMIDF